MGPRRCAVAAITVATLVSGAGSASADEARHIPLRTTEVTPTTVHALAGGSTFTAVTPVRVLDTRTGTGGVTGPVGQRGTITLDLSERIPASASAVVLNVTGTAPTTSTFITVYPVGFDRPTASNLNLTAGATRPNAVTVGLGGVPAINLYNHNGSVHLIADLAGYYVRETGPLFNTRSPVRVLDTRSSGGPLGPRGTRTLDLSNEVPPGTTAVTFNLTGIAGGASTFVTAWPSGATRPDVSNLNLAPGQIAPNQVTVALGADLRVNLFNNNGDTHLVADLVGFYTLGNGNEFIPTLPSRVFDTRAKHEGLTPDSILVAIFQGRLPDNAQAVVGNLTGTNATAPMFVTTWPPPSDIPPNASNLNLVAGQTVSNLITTRLGQSTHGLSMFLANNNGYVDVILDVAGYFVPFST